MPNQFNLFKYYFLSLELLLGSTAGFIFAILGMGPGLIFVSSLHTVCNLPLKKSIVGSLLLIVPISSVTALLHYTFEPELPDFIEWLLLGTFIGVLIGLWIRKYATRRSLKITFCSILLMILIRHWLQLGGYILILDNTVILQNQHHFIIGFLASLLSSTMGIGGGVIIVTCYFSLLNFHPKISTQIATYVVLLNAWLNTLLCYKQLYWNPSLTKLLLGAFLGNFAGVIVFQSISEYLLRTMYGILLIIILLKMVISKESSGEISTK